MTVRFSVSALADIQSIYDIVAQEAPSAAARIVSGIDEAAGRLDRFPLSGRIGAVELTRELVVPLPHIVVYRVTEGAVEIIAVFHAARDIPRG